MTSVETADGPQSDVNEGAAVATVPEVPELTSMEPTIVMIGDEEVFDFSGDQKPIKFKIDGDVFEAVRDLPALTAMEFGQYANTLETSDNLDDQAKAVDRMFRLVLKPKSAEKFIERLTDSEEPIGAKQMNGVMMWLMGKYGFRPTAPSEVSSDGS